MPQIRAQGVQRQVLTNSPGGPAASSGDEGEGGDGGGGASRYAASIFESYADAYRQQAGSGSEEEEDIFEAGLQRVSEHLLSAGAEAACLVCLEAISPTGEGLSE